ncbi:MAG TPA: hypothetical protein VFQ65_02685, partial [Kofleriaceae bacterium]|nr:hypothetical protein [Kofleriaceae bacterium]
MLATTASAAPFRAVPAAGAIERADVAERIAKTYLAQHLAELAPGASASDFVITTDRVDDGIRSVGFEQRWNGSRVVGGQLGFVFAHDKLTDVIAKAVPNVAAQPLRRAVRGERVVLRTANGDRVVDRVTIGDDDIFSDDRGEVARISRRRDATGTLQLNAGVRYASGPRSDTLAHTASITVDSVATTTAANGTFSWAGSAA